MELPVGITRQDIKSAFEEWKTFKQVDDIGIFAVDDETDDTYCGLCEYFNFKLDSRINLYEFFKRHYSVRLSGYLHPNTVETRIEVLKDILERTKDV